MYYQERISYDGKKVYVYNLKDTSARGNNYSTGKKMISKPCHFQHVQGTQAIDGCMGIEKIKSDIADIYFLGLGTKAGRSDTERSASKAEKKESGKEKSIKASSVSKK